MGVVVLGTGAFVLRMGMAVRMGMAMAPSISTMGMPVATVKGVHAKQVDKKSSDGNKLLEIIFKNIFTHYLQAICRCEHPEGRKDVQVLPRR